MRKSCGRPDGTRSVRVSANVLARKRDYDVASKMLAQLVIAGVSIEFEIETIMADYQFAVNLGSNLWFV
ncbi:MAG: hypothetical protein KME17_04670 [Cyanosarcina radialis HA8281-LM2]|nr:hypothetical protein [Cyanosarcina radialis HA8281-LM2]